MGGGGKKRNFLTMDGGHTKEEKEEVIMDRKFSHILGEGKGLSTDPDFRQLRKKGPSVMIGGEKGIRSNFGVRNITGPGRRKKGGCPGLLDCTRL